MKKKIFSFLCGVLLASGTMTAQSNGSFSMTVPTTLMEYQIAHVSPNGKWACGIINNDPYNSWVWDLTSGELTELTPLGIASMAVQVSDEGIVAGTFLDTKVTTNGAAIESAGYWKEGKWYHLGGNGADEVFDYDGAPMANAISPNGRYVGGQMLIKGVYTPVVWDLNDGTVKPLPMGKGYTTSGQPYLGGGVFSVADDGKAAGWTYITIKRPGRSDKTNRTSAIWTPDLVTPDTTEAGVEHWCFAKLSPDGNKAVAFRTLYDVATGEKSKLSVQSIEDYDILGVCNDGSLYGQYVANGGLGGGGFIYTGGKFYDMTQYLASKGVDMERYMIGQVVGVSSDKNTIAVMAYDMEFNGEDGAYKIIPVVFKLNQNITTREPAGIKAMILEGANAVKLSWNKPLAGADGVTAYELYRGDTKVATLAADVLEYIDVKLPNGIYSYSVKAVYGSATSVATEAVDVTIASAVSAAPTGLMGLQARVNDVRLLWTAPATSLPTLKYHNDNDEFIGWGWLNYTVEAGVRYTAEMLAAYGDDAKIEGITFAPMTPRAGWEINVYDADNTAVSIYKQKLDVSKLNFGELNTVKFTSPLAVPAGKDIIVAVTVFSDASTQRSGNMIGRIMGKKVIGYTDLVRRPNTDANFSSMYELSMTNPNMGAEDNGMWPIGVVMSNAANAEKTVNGYQIWEGDTQVGTTAETAHVLKGVSEGDHTYTVAATYADGSVSEKLATTVNVKNNYSSLDITNLKAAVDGYKAVLTWDAPVNDDATMISYATGDNYKNGLIGSKDYNYSYTVAHAYTSNMLKAYKGYKVKAFRFLPLGKAYFAFYLYKNNEEIVYKEVNDGEYTLGQWNTIVLDQPLDLDHSAEYTLALECFEPDSTKAPVALDLYASHTYSGDLFKQGEDDYKSLSESEDALSGNWMIGMVIAGEDEPYEIKGYNVRQAQLLFGEKLLTETPITDTKYEFTSSQIMDYTFRVTPVYDEPIGERDGLKIKVTIDGVSGIEDIKTEDIISYAVYTLSGVKVAEVEGSNLDAQGLSNGIYMFKIKTVGGEINRKAVINK